MLCISCQLAPVMGAARCALKGACQGHTAAKYGNSLDGRVDLDILGRRRRLRPSCHLECSFPFSCSMRSKGLWKDSLL